MECQLRCTTKVSSASRVSNTYAEGATPLPHMYSIDNQQTKLVFVVQRFQSEVHCARTQFFFDPQQLVVLCNAIRPARRTSLDLTHPRGHRKIRDKRILALP